MSTHFVQIHTLASYPAVLLNRDDAGLAKRLPYGGASRLRISSQCLKRHWRMVEDEWALRNIGEPMGFRSREVVEREIIPALSGAAEPGIVAAVGNRLVERLYGKNSLQIRNRQALLLGKPEVEYLTRLAREAAAHATTSKAAETALDERLNKGDGKRNLAALKDAGRLAAGLEAALFGRMVTSDPEANIDAPIHVAHAFTVHEEESESDYFTVVDDLTREAGEAGSAGMFESELTSGLFYGYVVVDVAGLVSNAGADRDLAGRLVEHLLHLIATVSPGAKKGSTAPYSWADLVLVEVGTRQPRSLAGAFHKPLPRDGNGLGVRESAVRALESRLATLDRCYGRHEERQALCTIPAQLPGVAELRGLDELASWAAAAVRGGGA